MLRAYVPRPMLSEVVAWHSTHIPDTRQYAALDYATASRARHSVVFIFLQTAITRLIAEQREERKSLIVKRLRYRRHVISCW